MARVKFLFLATLIWLFPLQMTAVGGETTAVNVSATILSKNLCKFNSNKAALDFGTLDPSIPVTRSVSTTISFVCNGSALEATYSISDNGGLNGYRMVHETDAAQVIPYTLSLSPTSGNAPKSVDQILTIDGSIEGVDYQTALVGSYSDTVTITIDP